MTARTDQIVPIKSSDIAAHKRTGSWPFNSAATLNIPMAQKVLDHLRAHPEEHNQDHYGEITACGTSRCIAGTAVWLDSDTTLNMDPEGFVRSKLHVDGVQTTVEDRASELLGLIGLSDRGRLFHDYYEDRVLDKLANYIEQAEAAQR